MRNASQKPEVQFGFEDFPNYSSDLTFYTGSSQEWKYKNYDNIIILYQDKDQDIASWLDKAKIDKALFDIANKFGIQSSYRVPILIYPSNSDFIKNTDYMGQGILFNKTSICINPEVIYHISGKKKDYENIFRTIKHEYTHFSARELTQNLSIPILIDEGLAEYIANCIPPFERNNYLGIGENLLKNSILNNTLLNWSILFRSDYEFFSQGPKETNINNLKLMSSQAFSFITYIANKYGFAKIISLLNALSKKNDIEISFYEVYGKSFQEIEHEWTKRIKRAILSRSLNACWLR